MAIDHASKITQESHGTPTRLKTATAAHASAALMALNHSQPGPGWISWAAPSCCTENCAAPARSASSMITVHAPSSTLRRVQNKGCMLST